MFLLSASRERELLESLCPSQDRSVAERTRKSVFDVRSGRCSRNTATKSCPARGGALPRPGEREQEGKGCFEVKLGVSFCPSIPVNSPKKTCDVLDTVQGIDSQCGGFYFHLLLVCLSEVQVSGLALKDNQKAGNIWSGSVVLLHVDLFLLSP